MASDIEVAPNTPANGVGRTKMARDFRRGFTMEEIDNIMSEDGALKYIWELGLPVDTSDVPESVIDVINEMNENLYDSNGFLRQGPRYGAIYADDSKVVIATNAGLMFASCSNGWDWQNLEEERFVKLLLSCDLFEDW